MSQKKRIKLLNRAILRANNWRGRLFKIKKNLNLWVVHHLVLSSFFSSPLCFEFKNEYKHNGSVYMTPPVQPKIQPNSHKYIKNQTRKSQYSVSCKKDNVFFIGLHMQKKSNFFGRSSCFPVHLYLCSK